MTTPGHRRSLRMGDVSTMTSNTASRSSNAATNTAMSARTRTAIAYPLQLSTPAQNTTQPATSANAMSNPTPMKATDSAQPPQQYTATEYELGTAIFGPDFLPGLGSPLSDGSRVVTERLLQKVEVTNPSGSHERGGHAGLDITKIPNPQKATAGVTHTPDKDKWMAALRKGSEFTPRLPDKTSEELREELREDSEPVPVYDRSYLPIDVSAAALLSRTTMRRMSKLDHNDPRFGREKYAP